MLYTLIQVWKEGILKIVKNGLATSFQNMDILPKTENIL